MYTVFVTEDLSMYSVEFCDRGLRLSMYSVGCL